MKLINFTWSVAVAALLVASVPSPAPAAVVLADLENALMCKCDDKCGKVLINCTCSTAGKTRAEFTKMLESGLTVEQIIQAQVPVAEVQKYSSELRSLTSGEGAFTMEVSHYDIVPSNIAQGIIEGAAEAMRAADAKDA